MKSLASLPQLPAVVVEDLRHAVGPQRLLTDPLSLHLYQYDAALERRLPAAVALPESTEEVAALVRVCARHRVPFVPRGAGTSLSGGPIPAPGSLVISLTRMDRILEVRPDDLCAVVQPGVVNLDLQKRLEPLGLFFAPDPSSQLVSTLGGNVGHNAGGAHCLKYGVTANHILALEVVTAEGEVVRLGGWGDDPAGYNLPGLWVGSEGTLGIVTEITCRLLPLPEAVSTALVIFDSLAAASAAVADIIGRGIVPAALEMIDRPLIEAVERTFHAGYPLDAEAVLLIDVDGPRAALGPQLAAIREVCEAHQAREFHQAEDLLERERLWRGRKGTAAAIANLAPGKISTDVSVPRSALPQMLERMTQIAERHHLLIGNILHAGDGNLHPQITFDPRDADQKRRVMAAQEEIVRAALDLGGAMTGEHGVGAEKRKFMPLVFSPPALALLKRIRRALDPEHLCNPDKLLPEETPSSAGAPVLAEGAFERVADSLAVRDEAGHFCPYDYEAMAKLLALATREGQAVALRGAGTGAIAPDEGGPGVSPAPAEGREVISTLGLHRIVSIDAANATAVVQAGVRVKDLQAALAEHGQWWPVLPPGGPQATVGGVLAAGRSGPLALGYGRLADLVTGLCLALPTGEIVRFGAACVKNVAGYAAERLLVGSQGTLAAIVEATLRTALLPAASQTCLVRCLSPGLAGELCRRLLRQPARPVALQVVNGAVAQALGLPPGDEQVVLAAWQGSAEEVAAGVDGLSETAASLGLAAETLAAEREADLWPRLANLPEVAGGGEAVEITCRPSRCLEAMAAVAGATAPLEQPVLLSAAPGAGSLVVGLPPADPEALAGMLSLLRTIAETRGGLARRLPLRMGKPLSRAPAGLSRLQARLKQAFDPGGVLPRLRDLIYE